MSLKETFIYLEPEEILLLEAMLDGEWKRAKDLGGTSHSSHHRALTRLAYFGLVEQVARSRGLRNGLIYRITAKGVKVLEDQLRKPMA